MIVLKGRRNIWEEAFNKGFWGGIADTLREKEAEKRFRQELSLRKDLLDYENELQRRSLQNKIGLLRSLFGERVPEEYPYMAASLLGARPIIPRQPEPPKIPKEIQFFEYSRKHPEFEGFLKKLQAPKGAQRIPADIQVFHEYSTNPVFREWWDRKQNKSLAALAFKMAADADLLHKIPGGMTKEEYAEYLYNKMVSLGKTKTLMKKKNVKKKPSVFDILNLKENSKNESSRRDIFDLVFPLAP